MTQSVASVVAEQPRRLPLHRQAEEPKAVGGAVFCARSRYPLHR